MSEKKSKHKPSSATADQRKLWYKNAVIYQLHVRAFYDADNDGIGDFRGLAQRLDYIKDLGADAIWLLPFYQSPLRDDGYDISDYKAINPAYGTLDEFRDFVEAGACPRHPRHHRAGRQPQLRPAPVVPARPPRPARQPRARLLRVERHRPRIRGSAHHLHRFRGVELDLGPGRQGLLLAPLLRLPARPQFRQPAGRARDQGHPEFLARSRGRRVPPRRGAVPGRARGHHRRESPRDAQHPEADPRRGRAPPAGMRAAGRGQPAAGIDAALFRRRRRVPDGVSLPADAAAVHEPGAGGCGADRRHRRADPGPARGLPVGAVPAQPRRVDARNGHRGRAAITCGTSMRLTAGCVSTSVFAGAWRPC